MKPRLTISDKLKQFLYDYFDEDAEYLVEFFINGKKTNQIALERTMRNGTVRNKINEMVSELVTIVEDLK